MRLPSSTVHVVLATSINLVCLPYYNWAVMSGDQHQIAAELYDTDNNKIHISDVSFTKILDGMS